MNQDDPFLELDAIAIGISSGDVFYNPLGGEEKRYVKPNLSFPAGIKIAEIAKNLGLTSVDRFLATNLPNILSGYFRSYKLKGMDSNPELEGSEMAVMYFYFIDTALREIFGSEKCSCHLLLPNITVKEAELAEVVAPDMRTILTYYLTEKHKEKGYENPESRAAEFLDFCCTEAANVIKAYKHINAKPESTVPKKPEVELVIGKASAAGFLPKGAEEGYRRFLLEVGKT